jgi:hypothetical protein
MSNPTSNFNWQMPTATDLVTDLPADFEVFGQAVDTSLADLKGGTTGQVLSKTSGTDMDFTWVAQDDSNAIQNAIVDAKGDLIAASAADTPARLAVGADGETLVCDSSTSTGLRYQGNFAAGKNAIINGDFRINQRNFTSNTANGAYNFDRFGQMNSGGTVTVTPQTFTPGAAPVAGYEGTNFVRLATTGQSTTSNYSALNQKIEDVRTFANQTVTLSFWAKANSGTPYIWLEYQQNFGGGGSASAVAQAGTTQTISTSWARYSVTFALPSLSGKTIGTSNFLDIIIWTSLGSALRGYSNATFQNNTIDIWGVQVEVGSVATAFQTATGTIQGELAACQRYYFRESTGSGIYSPYAFGGMQSTTQHNCAYRFPVVMRSAPTLSFSAANTFIVQTIGNSIPSAISASSSNLNTSGAVVSSTIAATTAGNAGALLGGGTASFIEGSAEL